MDPSRTRRKEEINQALRFIESSLAYPDPEDYKEFLTKLVSNLLDEGNAFFQAGAWVLAIKELTEALNVSSYAEASNIQIPVALLESLYVTRASSYHSMGKFDQGVQDCNSALEVCSESRRAMHRKALCLKELGQYKEAYSCTTNYLLLSPQDKQVNELAQGLSVHLGLRTRKPYVSTKSSSETVGNGVSSFVNLPPGIFPSIPQSSFQPSVPSHSRPPSDNTNTLDESELIGDDLDGLLDNFPTEQTHSETAFLVPTRTSVFTHASLPGLPDPTPQLPPAFFSSAISQLNSLDSFSAISTGTTLDILDDFSTNGVVGGASSNLANAPTALNSLDTLDELDDLLDQDPSLFLNADLDLRENSLNELRPLQPLPKPSIMDGKVLKMASTAPEHHQLDSLDSFESFPSAPAVPPIPVGASGLDTLSDFSTNGVPYFSSAAAPVTHAPKNYSKEKNWPGPAASFHSLSATHEFLQACATCFPREGVGIYNYVHKPDLPHDCERDILLCRLNNQFKSNWTRVRRIPTPSGFFGPFVLCREVLNSEFGICKYGEKCTFAYNELEIDVWTEERKGRLDRDLLFGVHPRGSITHLLQEHKGTFMYLCQICYDNKPRIISKRKNNVCSNEHVCHNFDANKCLAFVMRSHNVNYYKIRPLTSTCYLDLCRNAVKYGCQKEETCPYAHSVIEFKTWKIQQDTGIRPNEIVKVSEKYEKQMENSQKPKPFFGGGESNPRPGGGAGKNLNMKMKFVCGPCLRDGPAIEPSKDLKHCSAKARHPWTKDKQVLLVRSLEKSKWVQVRPLPQAKHYPAHYEICTQILRKRKCNFTGNCTFAHSEEEKKMWTYMKNNDLRDMQQMYDLWLSLTMPNRPEEEAQHASNDRDIVMPTDHAEQLDGFHCRLCGRHSNSERQWQKHISSEKHKDRVFSCEGEDEALTWSYRFPGPRFELCPKLTHSCPDGVSCDFAHSAEELQEWIERRDYLRQKLDKAREDMLIMPDEFDFGKFNFLLQD